MIPVDDLVAWLTKIWDVQEKLASIEMITSAPFREKPGFTVAYLWTREVANENGTVVSSRLAPGAPTPTEVLARIAADRQILALHKMEAWGSSEPGCILCHEDYDWGPETVAGPCETVKLLAQPYADHPGFEEAWRVTA